MNELESVWSKIDIDEVKSLALTLGNIDSPVNQEQEVAEYVANWFRETGFTTKVIALRPDRPNVLAKLNGEGGGKSLIFNSHMDTSVFHDDPRKINPDADIYHSAWLEDGVIHGHGVLNDKGPMAAWMIAARAVLRSGVKLRGDLLLSAVCGEIGHEPIDEYQGVEYSGKDCGTRYLITHGGVADFALVAEATDFNVGWVEAGKAFCKVSIYGGHSLYNPYVPRRTVMADSPNAIVQAARFIEAFEQWANDYEDRYRYESEGGVVIPKANIGAIRGGAPYAITKTSEVCHLYLDLRLAPKQSAAEIPREIQKLLDRLDIRGDVELYVYRPGYEGEGVDPLVDAVRASHDLVMNRPTGRPPVQATSMWRDINCFNEAGIPAVMYGPGGGTGGGGNTVTVEDLYLASRVYAGIILKVCNMKAGD